jgi:small subunit ribosomal protein S1
MSPETDNQPTTLSAASAAEAEPDYRAEQPEETPQPPSEAVPLEVSATTPDSPQGESPAELPVESGAPAEGVSAVAGEPSAEGGEPALEESSAEGMSELMDQMAAHEDASTGGEFVEGTVVAINDLGVVVDFGAKSEGLILAQEFAESEGAITLLPDQKVYVQVLSEHKEHYRVLSYLRARRRKAWENIEKSYHTRVTLTGKVVDRIKGGLVVDVGIRAFLPASQVDVHPIRELDSWKGQDVQVRVLKMNRKRGNVVVSRRIILEEDLRALREHLLESLTEGTVMVGKVKNLTDYGVFVDLGGLDGLLHVTDLSWGRITKPSEFVQPGQEIEVKVLKFDKEKLRVSLGHKQLMPDPWEGLAERFPVGSRVSGKVVGVTDYGAFVELEPGVEGLVHVSEMSWSKRMKHPSKIVKVGDEVEVLVLDLKPDQRRVSLGLKQLQPDPWNSLSGKYPIGATVSGKIRNLTDFGAFVEIEEGIDGLIHVSDISWTQRIKHPSEVLKKGDTVEARVLKIDSANRRLSLGLKQLNDIWSNWFEAHKVNDVVLGKVARSTTFGVFVELAEGIEALCHVSEIEERRPRADRESGPRGSVAKSGVQLDVGKEYDFKIIKLDRDQHKIGLSYRGAQKQAERNEIAQYRSSKSSSTATLGDIFWAKRDSSS